MKSYKTYQARNAVKAAQVTNHIIAAKKNGASHLEAKAEAYRLYNIKAGLPFLVQGLKTEAVLESYRTIAESVPKVQKPVPAAPPSALPPLPPLPKVAQKPAPPTPEQMKRMFGLPPLPKVGA